MKLSIFTFIFCTLINSIYTQDSNDHATMLELENKMKAENHEDRRDAALILGKYQNQKSTELLIKALKDENHLVRRASLVSLQDRLMKRMVASNYYATLFDTLSDKDPEVRRISSGSIQFYLPILLSIQSDQLPGEDSLSYSREHIIQQIIASSLDPDKGVRKNILSFIIQSKHLFFNSNYLQKLKKCLEDPEDENCILALSIFPRTGVNIKTELINLVNRNKTNLNMAILNFMRVDASADKGLLKTLVNSNDLEVKVEALIYDTKSGNKEYQKELIDFLLLDTNPINLRIKLIDPLRYVDKSLYNIAQVTSIDSIDIKTDVFKQLEFFTSLEKAVALIEEELAKKNSSLSFNKILIQKILQLKKTISAKELNDYFESKDLEIRKMILQYCFHNNIIPEEVLFEGLLDDQEAIRLLSLDLISKQQKISDNNLSILVQFLEDPSLNIQAKSHSILMKNNDESKVFPVLQTIKNTKNA